MNVVREITRINQTELDIAINNPSASWHQQYSDSAYIFIGGLHYDLTEGDVITIFSQYGEVVDVNLPRANPNSGDKGNNADKDGASSSTQQAKPVGKGKHRGFGFLMYQDQRSTVLAVDNLNGVQVLGRTLRVDHVAAYKQPKLTDEEGNRVDAEVKSFNAAPPEVGLRGVGNDEDADQDGDLDDPMAAYFQQQRRREDKAKSKDGSRSDEQEREEKRRRKEERARIRAERQERHKHSSHSHSHDRRHRTGSHRDNDRDDDDRDGKRHSASEEQGVNRYEQLKKSRSVLDTDGPASRSRSPSPPSRSSRHRSHRSSQDQDVGKA